MGRKSEIGERYYRGMQETMNREDMRWAVPKIAEPRCEYCGTGPHAGRCPNCGANKNYENRPKQIPETALQRWYQILLQPDNYYGPEF